MKNKTEEKNLNQNVVIKDSNTKISKEANKNLLNNLRKNTCRFFNYCNINNGVFNGN